MPCCVVNFFVDHNSGKPRAGQKVRELALGIVQPFPRTEAAPAGHRQHRRHHRRNLAHPRHNPHLPIHRQTTRRPQRTPKTKKPEPPRGFGCPGCLATSHCGAGGNRTPVPQPVDELATTIPGIASDAETPTGRLQAQGLPRIVFPTCQRSFSPSAVFPAVIPHFCCRAVVEWPRATFLLTMTLHCLIRSGGESELLFGNSVVFPV